MSVSKAYVAPSPGQPLVPAPIERREVGPRDVLIGIRYCGICHSDIHTVRGEWGPRPYPLAPGHEIAGFVAQVGDEVTRYSVGDRVGVGCMVNSCKECPNCRAGEEQYCLNNMITTYGSTDRDGTTTQGGYATSVVVTEDFVLRIPDSLPLETAAPLLCAGATTYGPLRRWGAGPGKSVGVIGLGGVGHVAVKIAHAMGAEVTALSRSMNKKGDAARLGADHYAATSVPGTFEHLAYTFDLILNTVSDELDVAPYLDMLRLDGVFVSLGVSPVPITSFPSSALSSARRSYTYSSIAGIRETQEMLDFCARHGIGAEIELIGADQINAAYERVLSSDVRYRFVIDTSTL